MSIADLTRNYVAERGLTRDTAKPVTGRKLLEEAGEVMVAIAMDEFTPAIQAIAHELADVVISADWIAQHYGLSIEECIAMKTEKDRGRNK